MPRRQFVMMGVQYAPAAIKKTMAQRRIVESGIKELRAGAGRAKTQLLVGGQRLPAWAPRPDPASRSLWLAAWTARQRDAEPTKDVWRSFWRAQARPGTPDASPSFAAGGLGPLHPAPATDAAAEGRGRGAPTVADGGAQMSKAAAALRGDSLFRFARLGLPSGGTATGKGRPARTTDTDALASLRKLAATEKPRPVAKPAPSRSKLRKALLAYTAL